MQAHPFGGFERTVTTLPEDKEFIEKFLLSEFPEGLTGVNLLLFQASLLDTRLEPRLAVPPFAQKTMLAAVDEWLARRSR